MEVRTGDKIFKAKPSFDGIEISIKNQYGFNWILFNKKDVEVLREFLNNLP